MPQNKNNAKKVRRARKNKKQSKKMDAPRSRPTPFPRENSYSARYRSDANARMVVTRLGSSLANPFDQTECIPDGATGVGCFSTKELYTQGTGVGGSCTFMAWCPRTYAQRYVYTQSTTATPTVTSSWNAASAITSISSQYSKHRTISAGLRCSFIGNTSQDAGIALIGLVSGQTPLTTFNGLALNDAALICMNYKVIPVRNGAIATWRPVEFDHMSEWDGTYLPTPLAVTSTQNVPYMVVITYFTPASVGIFSVEAVANYEGQYNNQTYQPGGINSVPEVRPVSGWYEKVQEFASNVEPLMPLVGAVVEGVRSGGAVGAIRSIANGIAYPVSAARSGLPRLM